MLFARGVVDTPLNAPGMLALIVLGVSLVGAAEVRAERVSSCTLSGVVRRPSKKAATYVMLRALRGRLPSPPRLADLDAEGRFSFSGLDPGDHAVSASSRDRYPDTQKVTCTPGAPLDPVVLEPKAGGVVVRGRVLDSGGTPLPKAVVEVRTVPPGSRWGGPPAYVYVDHRAAFELVVPRGGHYTVAAGAIGHRYGFREVNLDPRRRTSGPGIPSPSAEAVSVAYRLVKLPIIEGKVVTPSGAPVPDALVYISDGPPVQGVRTDAAGQFRILGDTEDEDPNRPDYAEAWWNSLSRGVSILDDDIDWDPRPTIGRRRLHPEVTVSARSGNAFGSTVVGALEQGKRYTATLRLRPARTLRGTLTTGGRPSSGVVVWVVKDLDARGRVTADDKGRFVIEGLPHDRPVYLQTRGAALTESDRRYVSTTVPPGATRAALDRTQTRRQLPRRRLP